jgi:hypothetical protein
LFFTTTLVMAIFGAHPQPTAAAAHARASAEASPVVAAPPVDREPEPRFDPVDLSLMSAPAEPTEPPRESPSASAKPTLMPKRRAVVAASASAAPNAPSAAGEADLFDGRK